MPTRRLMTKELYNARDLGGFPTMDGRTTRFGVFVRSEAPCDLPEEDIAYLRDYGVTASMDFRGTGETQARPSDLSGIMPYYHRPLFNEAAMGAITLAMATAYSSNTVFAQLGVDIGADRLVAGADKFGFDHSLDFDLPVTDSVMGDPAKMTEWETAWAAAGQPVGDEEQIGPFTTVLEMALVGCGIANDGVIMKPYLVEGVYNANGQRSHTAQPTPYLTATSKQTAQRVTEMLKGVVEYGTGTFAQIGGVTVAGKTGTAETGKEHDDSWFVGFAGPENDPQVVVAIVLEEAVDSEYSDNAAMKARDVLETALQIEGVL